MSGKKNPNLGDKLRQERQGAENTLRDSRNKAADSSTGDSSKKKAEHRRQIRHEADLAKLRSKKLKSEQEIKAKKNAAASGKKGAKPKKPVNLAADALSAKAHQSVRNADQDNNSGVEAAHFTEGSAEGAARAGSRFQYGRKLRQYKKLERLEKKADKDAVDSIFTERMKSDPQAASNFFSRWRQKQAIKKEYAAAKAGAAATENTAAGTAKAAQGTASITEKAFQFVQSHSHIIIGIAAVGLLVLVIAGSVSSCSVLINGGGNVVLGTSYTAEDEDLKGVETDYTKAEKYLGYPYVWGGSSPSTSFDCSGFVSWVINHCGNGWNVGRQTANGLMGKCDIIPKSEAKPGDLIFFQKTYNTSGASHVGIYVGNGMMIHCGNPISYASIETSYWRQHYYCMGRIR